MFHKLSWLIFGLFLLFLLLPRATPCLLLLLPPPAVTEIPCLRKNEMAIRRRARGSEVSPPIFQIPVAHFHSLSDLSGNLSETATGCSHGSFM